MRYVPVSREEHYGKRLRPLSSFAYAAGNAAVEVVLGELPNVASCYPMFFAQQAGAFKLVALLGLAQGENLFVDSMGTWTGFYIPAMLRAHPFTLAKLTEGEDLTIMVDEDAGLLSDEEGEPLFGTEQGEPNGPLARAIQLLTQLSFEGGRTVSITEQLNGLGLLKETSLNIERKMGNQGLTGLYAVDEAALNALPDADFLALKQSGALSVAFAQLLSQGQLARLRVKANAVDQGRDSAIFS